MSQGRLLQGRRSFKTINMKLNKPENLCSKIDFRKADAHMGRLLSTWDDLNLPPSIYIFIYIYIYENTAMNKNMDTQLHTNKYTIMWSRWIDIFRLLHHYLCAPYTLHILQAPGNRGREPSGPSSDYQSIDWLNGNITGKSRISWENLWFPVNFPLSQPIEPEDS